MVTNLKNFLLGLAVPSIVPLAVFILLLATSIAGADNNIFKATFGSSFGSLSFGNVAQTGLSEAFVLSDLTIVGSLAGGGDLGSVDFVYVPEPASFVFLVLGLLALLSMNFIRSALPIAVRKEIFGVKL